MNQQKEFKYHVNTKIIYDYMKENNLNKKEFAKRCNINIKTLRKVLTGFNNISVLVIYKLLVILKAKSRDFIGF